LPSLAASRARKAAGAAAGMRATHSSAQSGPGQGLIRPAPKPRPSPSKTVPCGLFSRRNFPWQPD